MKNLKRSLMNLLSTVTHGKKNVQYFTGRLNFSKFDKCDVKSYLHKVTEPKITCQNLTGRLLWPLMKMC